MTTSRALVAITLLGVAVAPLAAQQSLTPGQRVRGTLAAGDAQLGSGEFMDTYTVAGRAGQRLVIRLTSGAFDPYVFIRGPSDFSADNDDEASGSTAARLDVRLPADGTYRIVATSYRAGEQGDYELEVTEGGAGGAAVATGGGTGAAGGGGGGVIAVGQTGRGTLAQGDETLRTGEFADAWRFTGRRGQQVTVRLASADFDAYVLARGPGGFSQDNDDDEAERGSRNSRLVLTLPADGEYRFLATSYRPGESGAYMIAVEGTGAAATAPAPAARPAAGSITPGQSVAGRLQQGDAQLRSGEFVDAYAFSGTFGQRLEIRLTSSEFDPYVAITGPGGFSEFNDDDVDGGTTASRLVVTLPADGAYQVVATSYRPGESGAYQLSVAATGAVAAGAGAGANASALALGQAAQGTLAAGDDTLPTGELVDRYTFTGRRGQRLAVDLGSQAFDAYVQLIAPSGRQEENDDAANGVNDSRIETILTEEGSYTVLATSFQRGGAGAYQVSVSPLEAGDRAAQVATQDLPADAGGLALGTAQSGRLERGDRTLRSGEFVDYYRFAGVRGQVVTVEMASSDLDAYVIVQAPDGTQQENDDGSQSTRNARVTWVLPSDGTYSILATSYRPGEAGAYSVRVARGAAIAPATAGRPAPGAAPAPAPGAAPSRAGQRVWAVMVGISEYGGAANDLPYTAEDAIKLGQTLRREGVLAEGSVVLTDAEATYDRVRQAFQQVAQQAGPDDVFLFFYSGHGTQMRQNPSSTEADRRDEAIVLRDRVVTDDEMAEWFRGVHSRIGLLALDACFSGGFARDVIDHPGVMGLFSSEEDLTSAVAGKFQAGGYLSHFLRTGLAGEADESHDGTITAGELSTYLRHQFATQAADVEAETMDRQRNYQFLVIERGGVKIDDVVLARR